jgi:hypothetical protein
MTATITPTYPPPANGNPGTVPPDLQYPDRPIPLPDPVGDTPMILPMPEWPPLPEDHERGVLARVAEIEFRCDEAMVR